MKLVLDWTEKSEIESFLKFFFLEAKSEMFNAYKVFQEEEVEPHKILGRLREAEKYLKAWVKIIEQLMVPSREGLNELLETQKELFKV